MPNTRSNTRNAPAKRSASSAKGHAAKKGAPPARTPAHHASKAKPAPQVKPKAPISAKPKAPRVVPQKLVKTSPSVETVVSEQAVIDAGKQMAVIATEMNSVGAKVVSLAHDMQEVVSHTTVVKVEAPTVICHHVMTLDEQAAAMPSGTVIERILKQNLIYAAAADKKNQ